MVTIQYQGRLSNNIIQLLAGYFFAKRSLDNLHPVTNLPDGDPRVRLLAGARALVLHQEAMIGKPLAFWWI